MEYAIRDAQSLGMEEVVIIISHNLRADFESLIVSKYQENITITLVEQTQENTPTEYKKNPERIKPWGTAHAVWCAREAIK